MRKTNKKGFTLVELLVVIAIVAILATVAIVGYTSFTRKAEISADQQAVTQMNKVLEADAKLNGTPADVDAVKTLLIANDYNGALTTYYKGYQLAWIKADNIIVLVENNAVVYPEAHAGKTSYEPLTRLATDASSLADGLKNGETLHVNANINANDGLSLDMAGEFAVNLNGNTINASNVLISDIEGAKLVVSNGVIDATTTNQTKVVSAKMGGEVELNNVQVYSSQAVTPIHSYGGKMVLNNVTAAQTGDIGTSEQWWNAAIMITNGYNEQAHNVAELTINGGLYSGKKAISMTAPGAVIVINDGVFTGSEYVIAMDGNSGYATLRHEVTINGGTFNGNIRLNQTQPTTGEGTFSLVLNGGTFNGNIVDGKGNVLDASQFLGEGKTIVNNADGTWTVQ